MTQINFSVKGLIIKDHEFLAPHKVSSRCEYFDLPGGKMKPNESAEEALCREILEETSLVVRPIHLLQHWDFITDDYLIMGVIYLCEILEGEITLSNEHDYYEWLPLTKESIPLLTPSLAHPLSQLNLETIQKNPSLSWDFLMIKIN